MSSRNEFGQLKKQFSTVNWILGVKVRRVLQIATAVQILLAMLDIFFLALIGPLVMSMANETENLQNIRIIPLYQVSLNVIFLLIFGVVITKNVGNLLIQKWTLSALSVREAEVGTALVRASIFEKTDTAKLSNSAELLQTIVSIMSRLFGAMFLPTTILVGEIATLFAVVIGLLVVSPVGSILAITYLATFGLLGARYLVKHQQILGKESLILGKESLQKFSEITLLNQELRLAHKEGLALSSFHQKRTKQTQIQVRSTYLTMLPRNLLELLVVLGIAFSVVLNTLFKEHMMLSTLALFVAAGYRILPSMNSIIVITGTMRNAFPMLDRIDILGNRFNVRDCELIFSVNESPRKKKRFNGDLIFENVTYRYPESESNTIEGLNLQVPRNQTLLIVGPSGSGKSTVVSLAGGILRATEGRIFAKTSQRETVLDETVSGISFLSQVPPFLDSTFAYNIALRETTDSDFQNLLKISKMAGIDERIAQGENGLAGRVGENGNRLSAGERQRLGLARCLFENPSLLILDEPTASLDGYSENLIWESLENLRGTMTIIIVSHRPVPKRIYDHVLTLEGGV
jgi:ABC-type multidrug transport system fused ATPase/permease subunit